LVGGTGQVGDEGAGDIAIGAVTLVDGASGGGRDGDRSALAAKDRVTLPVYALVSLIGCTIDNSLANNSSSLVTTPKVASSGSGYVCGGTNAALGWVALPGDALVGLVGEAVGSGQLNSSCGGITNISLARIGDWDRDRGRDTALNRVALPVVALVSLIGCAVDSGVEKGAISRSARVLFTGSGSRNRHWGRYTSLNIIAFPGEAEVCLVGSAVYEGVVNLSGSYIALVD
jgi:hypothetical protein